MPATDAPIGDAHQASIDALMKVHGMLEGAYRDVGAQIGNLGSCRTDTGFAIGEAAGHLAKAKALVGRDIDDLKAAMRENASGTDIETASKPSKPLTCRKPATNCRQKVFGG